MEGIPIILLRIKKFQIIAYHTQMDPQPEKFSNIYLKIDRDFYNSKKLVKLGDMGFLVHAYNNFAFLHVWVGGMDAH